jgi:hypothetical protein
MSTSDTLHAPKITRRHLLTIASAGAATAALSGCISVPREAAPQAFVEPRPDLGYYRDIYGPLIDEG